MSFYVIPQQLGCSVVHGLSPLLLGMTTASANTSIDQVLRTQSAILPVVEIAIAINHFCGSAGPIGSMFVMYLCLHVRSVTFETRESSTG